MIKGSMLNVARAALLHAALLLSAANAVAAAEPAPGHYYSPAHNGHGFDFQHVGDTWVLVFYSYDANGEPLWYFATASAAPGGIIQGALDLFLYDATRFPAQQREATVGSFSLDFSVDCNAGASELSAAFNWTINGESDTWCVQPLVDQPRPASGDLTGMWFAGPEDQGWGLSIDHSGTAEAAIEVDVLFYYDTNGFPRWAFGVAGAAGPTRMFNYRGYCRLCDPVPLTGAAAGTISHAVEVTRGVPAGEIGIDLVYAFEPGGQWQRSASPLVPLSDPAQGLVQRPDTLEPDIPLAIEKVSVIPLTEAGLILEQQTVVVENGVITGLGPAGTVDIPDDAWHIDGRGLYLGPGLADMHTHFTYSGPPVMYEAGLLFIANGVTTVLNMGDGGTLDLPGTDDLFASGQWIGPTVYAGQAAYGSSDNRSSSLTVNSRLEATSFAGRIFAQGYQFIKLYNGLSPAVVDQFRIESQRLGLPLIGHLPKSMTMVAALEAGQEMVAHTAEVYFTFLGNQPNENLLPAAAEHLISRNVYLTDTLTASDSFANMFGGNIDNFNAYAQRDGVQYIPQSIVNSWFNYFSSSALQPTGSRPGQLDARLVFFKKMNRYFADAGVKMIMGTDSPGHTGVISGFSAHEDLRLLAETGLSPEQVYTIASANPGEFITGSLALETGFGTIETGKRADLVLVEANPLVDIARLKRPLVVIARGRLWSREYLQGKLDVLEKKYHPGGSRQQAQKVPASTDDMHLHGH